MESGAFRLKEVLLKPVVIDMETEAIGPRPDYPPKPVGVAVLFPGRKPGYLAWGHPIENNTSYERAREILADACRHPGGLLFHNAKFDLDVLLEHFDLRPQYGFHDTLLLAYLHNPHAASFALKPLADALLGMPPEERDAVRDWLRDKGVCRTQQWGAFIAHAPGELVGRYAVGDVVRTAKLFDLLMPDIKRRKMTAAYERELKMVPILIDMEARGIKVSDQLYADCETYGKTRTQVDAWIRRRLKAPGLAIDSNSDLVEALRKAGKVDLSLLGLTGGGEYRSDKVALAKAVNDDVLNAMLRYRGALSTSLRTFMEPWRATAQHSGGLVFVGWNQTRNFERGRPQGTVTGRLSSSPNFQNIPQEFPPLFRHEAGDPKLARSLPKCPLELPPLPKVRSYLAPYDGEALIDRDYSQQELRILGHFEDGSLKQAYCENPWLDIHDHAKGLIDAALGRSMPRKHVKTTGFGLLYGMGIARLAASLNIDNESARELKRAYLNAFPGLRELMTGLKELAQAGLPLRTRGGRLYHCEPPQIINGEVRTFEYKMLNVLIQGSAADCTKEAVIRYHESAPMGHELLLTVHDELLVSCPAEEVGEGHEALREAMEGVKFDVPMLSEGKVGYDNWGEMRDYDKKGKVLA